MKSYKTIKQRITNKHVKALIGLSREVNFVSANILEVKAPTL